MMSRQGEPELLYIRKVAKSSKWSSIVYTGEIMRARIVVYELQSSSDRHSLYI